MWFAFSLLTIVFWAGSDFFSKKGTRQDDKYSHLRLLIIVGTVMTVHAIVFILVTGLDYKPSSMLIYFPVSFMYILSMTLGYAGLRYIELSVSSPICNSSGAVSCILCAVFLHQSMETLQLVGVIMICIGIFLLSLLEKRQADKEKAGTLDKSERKYRVGAIAIIFPILYCLIDGLGTFADAYYLEYVMNEEMANVSYELTFGVCALLVFVYLRFVKKEKFSYFREKTFCAGALCETAGQFAYIYAMGGKAIVAAPMIASYSIFSVLLARVFLREKLTKAQYGVIFLVMAGIAILGIFDV
ncbi:MAG: EamA family transporter [Oscillospiraceae bacterium]